MDPKRVIQFWFKYEDKWFVKDPKFDKLIRQEFLDAFNDALTGKMDEWAQEPESFLSLIIVLDQFPRNMFRNTAEAFSGDEKAQALVKQGLALGCDKKLPMDTHRQFFYMPLMHSESLADQELSVQLYGQLGDELSLKFAQSHRDIIAKFGRFPHRNRILGRISTPEELEFLTKPGSSF